MEILNVYKQTSNTLCLGNEDPIESFFISNIHQKPHQSFYTVDLSPPLGENH